MNKETRKLNITKNLIILYIGQESKQLTREMSEAIIDIVSKSAEGMKSEDIRECTDEAMKYMEYYNRKQRGEM